MTIPHVDRHALGIPAEFTEPPAAARAALPRLDKAMQKLDQLRAKKAQLDIEVAQLLAGLPVDRQHDREALAASLKAGEPDPPSIAEAAEAMIDQLRRRAIAMTDNVDQEQASVSETIIRIRDSLTKDLEQRTAEHAAGYGALVEALEPSRNLVADDVVAACWLAGYPAAVPMPQVMMIDQPELLKDQPNRSFSAVRDDLRRDVAALPHRGPLNISGKAISRHRGFAAQEGGRMRWFRGGTPGQLDGLDRIAQIEASTRPSDAA
jgi:hypothetical protein